MATVFLILVTPEVMDAIALVTCFHRLAQPLSIGEVSRATVRAVGTVPIAVTPTRQ